MQKLGDFKLPHFFNYPPYFTLQPVRETREKQVQLWKELILDYCRTQKIFVIKLEEEFPLFSNSVIERTLSHEAREAFLLALAAEGRAEWLDKNTFFPIPNSQHCLQFPQTKTTKKKNTMENTSAYQNDLNLKATELRLGLPGTTDDETAVPGVRNNKRPLQEVAAAADEKCGANGKSAPPSKAQIVGWPPVQSYRKNNLPAKKPETEAGIYVKVSMDGAPYLRKIDLRVYKGYSELLQALENMFKFTAGEYSEREGYKGSDYAPTYEDKDGDWMLAGDVPWQMFITSCKRLRIMKGSEARGLGYGTV